MVYNKKTALVHGGCGRNRSQGSVASMVRMMAWGHIICVWKGLWETATPATMAVSEDSGV